MKKVMIILLVSFMGVAVASESVGVKSCAATKASQKREAGKKIASTVQTPIQTSTQASAVNQE